MTDERRVMAFHEAGHATAVLMSGGTLAWARMWHDGDRWEGTTRPTQLDACHVPFIAFAGPWTESRFLAGTPVVSSSLLVDRLMLQPSDRAIAGRHLSQFHGWGQRLEAVWPVIVLCADRINATGSLSAAYAATVFAALTKPRERKGVR